MNHDELFIAFIFLFFNLSICESHQDYGASCCSCSRCSCSSLLGHCGHRGRATRAHGELWDLQRHEIPWNTMTPSIWTYIRLLPPPLSYISLHGLQPTKHNKPRILRSKVLGYSTYIFHLHSTWMISLHSTGSQTGKGFAIVKDLAVWGRPMMDCM